MVKEVRVILGDEEHLTMRKKKGQYSWRQVLLAGVESLKDDIEWMKEVKK